MGSGIIILEQWQVNNKVAEKFLEDGKITKIKHENVDYTRRPIDVHYFVESADFPKSQDGRCYCPTYRVINNELVSCTPPLRIDEFEEAQKILKTIDDKNAGLKAITASLSYDVGKLEGEKHNLINQLIDMETTIKQKKDELSFLTKQIDGLDSEKINRISYNLKGISEILHIVEVKGQGVKVNSLFNHLVELRKLIESEDVM